MNHQQLAAVKQALEALEKIYIAPEHLDYIANWWPACRDSIPELRQVIAQDALDKKAENARELGLDYGVEQDMRVFARIEARKNRDAAQAKLEQQKPVQHELTCVCGAVWQGEEMVCAPHDKPSPVQEPVAWMQSDEVHISLWKDDFHTIPLYTTPPIVATPLAAQKPWVGLTDEEVQAAVYDENGCVVDYENYAVAIEAKLREKNGGAA